jgi:hypothetical protein
MEFGWLQNKATTVLIAERELACPTRAILCILTLFMVLSFCMGSSMRSTSPRTQATAPEWGALFLAMMGLQGGHTW